MHFAPLARCNTFGTLLLLLLPLTSQVLAELEITNVQKLSSPTGLEKDEAVNREKYPILYKTSISRLSNTEIIETQEGLRAYTDPKREWILQTTLIPAKPNDQPIPFQVDISTLDQDGLSGLEDLAIVIGNSGISYSSTDNLQQNIGNWQVIFNEKQSIYNQYGTQWIDMTITAVDADGQQYQSEIKDFVSEDPPSNLAGLGERRVDISLGDRRTKLFPV